MAEMAGRRRGDINMAVTAREATHIWICGRGCGKTVAMAVTTLWQSKLGSEVASEK